MKHLSKKRALVLGAVASIAVAAGAYAYFTSSGSGTGSATVGSSTAITIQQTNTLGALYPTTDESVALDITNPGSGAQYVGSVHLDSISADGAHSACVTTVGGVNPAFTMADVAVNATLAPGAVSSKTGTLKMNDTGVSQNSCQGATLTLNFSSN